MKRIYLLLALVITVGSAFAQTADSTKKKTISIQPAGNPVMTFESENHNFGQIKQGEKVRYVFKFTNTGNAPLVIEKTHASCGCTTPTYSEEPILPGQEGEIVVEFNSTGKSGMQAKTVWVYYNNIEKSPVTLTIQCVIE